jgi:transmembrane sensor
MRHSLRLLQEAIMTNIRAIDEVAARWHARAMLGQLSPEDEQRLDAWLAEDMRHRLAYADAAAASYAIEQAMPKVAPVVERRVTRRWPVWLGAALAPVLLFIVFIWTPHAWQDWHSDVRTVIGEVHSQRLPDGSTLQLDTDTAVALPFTPEHRDIELIRGELAVEVAKDTAHPFRVHCAGIEARAVGTRFVVARRDSEVEIGVMEGTVAVRADEHSEPTLLQAGQRARVDTRSGAISSEALPAVSYGWTRGVLSFDRVPLEQVVAEIARYLPEHVTFRASRQAAITPVTATFPLDHPDAALTAVAATNGLTIRHVSNLLYVVQD